MADDEEQTASGDEQKPADEEKPQATKAERPKAMPGGASAQRPTLQEQPAKAKAPAKAEAEEPAEEPFPPGTIADRFTEALPDIAFKPSQGMTSVIIEIDREDVPKVMQTAKEDPRLDFKFLRCLFGVDHMDDGLEVIYQLVSYDQGHEVTFKTHLSQDDPKVASVTSVWKGANWHERETRDMFGITFEDHPHLVPLLLPEDMTDHFPLRKDSPLAEVEEWQGDFLIDESASDEKEAKA